MSQKEKCPLCQQLASFFIYTDSRNYFKCDNCKGIFLSQQDILLATKEKERYLLHNNDVEDPGYRDFVSPISDYLLNHFGKHHQGLDFGAGTGPVISTILKENGYQVTEYDLYFKSNTSALNTQYDYIICCEVAEHFNNPDEEFEKLYSLLKENGKLLIMTDIYSPEIDFSNWYYKNDNTHVFFYQKETFNWIYQQYGFNSLGIEDRLIIMTK